MSKINLDTNQEITWCPGCSNFLVLAAVKRAVSDLIEKGGEKKENFVMTTGIGCHGKIFDYIDISGVYALHGRPIPVAVGIKLGNPKLKVLTFAGDGDTYAEGIAHFIHAARYNADITLIVHDNQTFALTTGQATPTSQEGFKTKVEPKGEFLKPLNPIVLALEAGASFVARANVKDLEETSRILERAIKHKGFSFVEMLQPCLQFNLEMNSINSKMYKIEDKKRSKEEALDLAKEWDYDSSTGKIPAGIFFEEARKTLDENFR